MKTLIVLLMLLLPGNAFAVCASFIQEVDRTTICIGGTCADVLFSDLKSASRKLQEVEMQEALQKFLDFEIALSALPLDDPDRVVDPDHPNIFWVDADGEKTSSILEATTLKSRACIITNVEWSDAEQTFIISIAVI